MKKALFTTLAAVLVLTGLSACNSPDQPAVEDDSDKLSIVTTIFPQYDFTRQIVGDKADVTMLLKPGAESHSYEPTPQDIKNIQNCDLFIYTGGENDVWVDDILNSMGDQKPETLRLVDCVPTVHEEIVEGMEHEHEDEDEYEHEQENGDGHEHEQENGDEHEQESEQEHEEETDEHVWTSPRNAVEIVDKITFLLCEKDQKNADTYKKNSGDYKKQLEELDASFREVVDQAKRKTLLFGDRFPFRYFADAYDLDYYAAFTGCSTETEVSAATVAFLTDKVKEDQLPVVFVIELSDGKTADTICEATGAKKMTLYSCHNITKDQMEDGATYLSMMRENVDSLRAALN